MTVPALTLAEPLVRPATEADQSAVRRLVLAAFGPYAGEMDPAVFLPYLGDLLDLQRHAAHGLLLVAEVDGDIAGFGAFYPDIALQDMGWPAGWAGGRGLAVHPSARHLGVARALLAACEERARALGAPVFAFHTVGFMRQAVALYNGLGYQRAPEHDIDLNSHYGVDTDVPAVAIAYRRDLEPRVPRRLRQTMVTVAPTRRQPTPSYYLGRPASFWLSRLSRRWQPGLRHVE